MTNVKGTLIAVDPKIQSSQTIPQTRTRSGKSHRIELVVGLDVRDVRRAIHLSALAVDAGVDDALGVDDDDADDAGVGAHAESGDGGDARRFGFF